MLISNCKYNSAPAQNNGQPVVANAAPPNPVPDPTFVSEMKSGGSFQFSHNGGQTQMAGDKMRVVKLTGTDPTTAVRQVAKEYYNNPNGPPDASPAERVKPPPPPEPVPTYVIEDR